MMRGNKELLRLNVIAFAAALGCGGAADATQQGSQGSAAGAGAIGPASPQGNADSLVVAMSMVLPKKQVVPPPMTAPAFPQNPAGGIPGAPGGAAPGGAAPAPSGAPGAPAGGAPTTPPGGAAPTGTGTPGGAAPAPGAGAAGAPATTATPSGTAAGAETSGVAPDELNMLRDVCVAEINMYRATVTSAMLKPLVRATAEQEECSQRGAKMDGDSMQAHGAARAGLCSSTGLSAENTCPGWPVGGGGRGGGQFATIADALKGCLKSMWDEGDPPMGRDACIQDQSGCFQMHGHYLNMSDPNNSAASCAFYKMSDGRSYWMNQDFASSFSGWGRRM